MKIILCRHGESVDNVAGLYAGLRDSALTNHGVEQTTRLGEHFAKNGVSFTHIFASPLSRALKTAEAMQKAQLACQNSVDIVKVPDLVEQDFGFYEGKPFQARTSARKTGHQAHWEAHPHETGFVDVESKDSMNKRADSFLDQHILPFFSEGHGVHRYVIAIVSHGILLSNLWRRLLIRFSPKRVTIAPEVAAAKGPIVLEHLGGWSNTGYLELMLERDDEPSQAGDVRATASTPSAKTVGTLSKADAGVDVLAENADGPIEVDGSAKYKAVQSSMEPIVEGTVEKSPKLTGWRTLIVSINCNDHLAGLKRQRGGIGRSAHDEKQRTLTSFFQKRQRTS